MDTICALATAPGRAGVAVIRISGPDAFDTARQLAGEVPAPGRFRYAAFRGADGIIDHGLILAFKSPASFTGEDVVELHVHGSIAVTQALLTTLTELDGIRPAQAGEFTKRALQNGKMNLTQVEGLADLIDAETQAQLSQALRTKSGALSDAADALRADLVKAAALIEATIDFADEDVPVDVTPEVSELLCCAQRTMTGLIDGAGAAERIRTGFEVAIVGAPNMGKSTLLNALAGREAAITSEIAGTTRDVIEVRLDIGGLPVTLLDTAGLRQSTDEVEAKGIALAEQRASQADLRVILTTPGETPPIVVRADDIVLMAKDDSDEHQGISGKTGAGVDRLLKWIETELSERVAQASLASHDRHRTALIAAQKSAGQAAKLIDHGPDHYDIAAAELRSAIAQIEALVGRVGVEDLLDDIFSSFCIGK